MKEPVWLLKSAVIAVHSMMIARFGGLDGIRDEGLIDSALAQPTHFYHHDHCTEVSQLAAATAMTLSLAASEIDEREYAHWLTENVGET